MASRREERMQQRMRGAQRHQVQEASFDLFLTLPDAPDAAAAAPLLETTSPLLETTTATTTATSPQPEVPVRVTPNTSAKRRRLNDGGSAAGGGAGGTDGAPQSAASLIARHVVGRPAEEEIGESPVDAPGSGRRRSVVASAAAANRSTALQQILSNTASSRSTRSSRPSRAIAAADVNSKRHIHSSSPPPPASSPPMRRRAANRSGRLDELSPELATITDVDLSSSVDAVLGILRSASEPEATATAIATVSAASTAAAKTAKPKAAGGGGVFSKLAAKSKQDASAATAGQTGPDNDAADELSSPSLAIILESAADDVTTSGMIPSSSPLARKSTAGARTTRATRSSRLPGESQASSTTTPASGGGKENRQVDDQDELSPDQPSTAAPQQRPSQLSPATNRTARVQRASEVPSSSPASRPTKRMPLHAVPPTSSPRQQPVPSPRRGRGRPIAKAKARTTAAEDVEEEEEEQAEEIDALEAARTIGRKRPRRSAAHEPSPDLGSGPNEAEPYLQNEAGGPAAKRRRRRQHLQEQSASSQNQPRPPKSSRAGKRVSSSSALQPAKATKKPGKRKRRGGDDDSQGEEDLEGVGKAGRSRGGAPVPITVQRFSQMRRKSGGGRGANGDGNEDNDDESDGDDDDELAAGGADLPFANRSGVNAVDVLAQICEDIVEQKLQALHEKHHQARQAHQAAAAAAADDGSYNASALASAARKEVIVARRALESFQQELRARLLEQAVAVDTLYALRKRVRAAQKDKLALREEILRIRAERDQVGLRMDALRAQHQDRVSKAMKTTNLSAAMHDIDLAVEQGRAAPELTAAHQKTADLANLELVVRRIAEQVSGGGGSGGGGTLQQIVEFNAFLERTAAVLEGRKLPAKIAAA